MWDNSDMIGDYKGTVKNRVITALLQSYLDNLDYDGMKSILREAELIELKDGYEEFPHICPRCGDKAFIDGDHVECIKC